MDFCPSDWPQRVLTNPVGLLLAAGSAFLSDPDVRAIPLSQRKPLPEIKPPHVHVVSQLVRGSGKKYTPLRNNVRPIGNTQRFAHVVICDQDADPAGLEFEDDLLQFQYRNRVDAAKGLI